MDHPCYKCGATVEDGTPFCKQCNAPQIRVGGDESTAYPGVSTALGVPLVDATGLQWSQALPACAFAGLIGAFLMFVPFGAFGIGMITDGVLAVLFYQRRRPGSILTPGMGARLGAVSGILGFGIFAIFTAIGVTIFKNGGELRTALLEAVQQSAARNADPQAQQIVEYLKTPAGLALVMVLGMAVMCVLFLIFSSLGGALAASYLRRKNHFS